MNKPTVQTEKFTFKLAEHERTWELQVIHDSGQIGVAAMGPIESLPIVLGILDLSGAKPHQQKKNPLFVVGEE